MIFPIPNSKYRILKEAYAGRGLRFTEIMRKTNVSTKTAAEQLKGLVESDMLIEETEKSGSKVLNRKFYPNFVSEEGRSIFSLLELENKRRFIQKYPKLSGPIKHLLTGIEPCVKIVLVFGSFANYSASKGSDLDILFLSDREVDLKKRIERSFSTVDYELSPRIESIRDFKNNISDSIHKTIIDNHVILFGADRFIDLIKEKRLL